MAPWQQPTPEPVKVESSVPAEKPIQYPITYTDLPSPKLVYVEPPAPAERPEAVRLHPTAPQQPEDMEQDNFYDASDE